MTSKAKLQNEIDELQHSLDFHVNYAQYIKSMLASNYHCASKALDKASIEKNMASAVVLELRDPKGNRIVSPVSIMDGLSQETIDAIRSDLKRSFDLATILKP